MNKRPVTVFKKLAIFLATMGFGANFTVRAPKCRTDNQEQNTYCKRSFYGVDSILQIGHRFLRDGVQQEFSSKSLKMSV